MRIPLLCLTLLASSCAANTGSPHSAIDYPDDVKLNAASITVSVKDPRTASDVPDGHDSLRIAPSFKDQAQQRIQRITSGKGLPLRLLVATVRADHAKVDTQQGPKLHIEVVFKFELRSEDDTVIKSGRGTSWAELPEDQVTGEEVAKVLNETALNAFDQYWADEETLDRINGNIALYRERKGL